MRLLVCLLVILTGNCYGVNQQVLTSIKPLQMIAYAVQDGIATPKLLLPANASVHSYSLRPSDMQSLLAADLFYWIGEDLESFLPKIIINRSQKSVAVQHLDNINLRYFNDVRNFGRQDSLHQDGMLDGHLWLSIANAQVIAQQMADDLSELDSVNAAKYQANAAEFKVRLDDLHFKLQQKLQAIQNRPFYVFHATFNYFIADFALNQQGVLSLANGSGLGAKQVALLQKQLSSLPNGCIFYEPPEPPKMAVSLVVDLPIKLAKLDALGIDIPINKHSYEQLLENLAADLVDCLQ